MRRAAFGDWADDDEDDASDDGDGEDGDDGEVLTRMQPRACNRLLPLPPPDDSISSCRYKWLNYR